MVKAANEAAQLRPLLDAGAAPLKRLRRGGCRTRVPAHRAGGGGDTHNIPLPVPAPFTPAPPLPPPPPSNFSLLFGVIFPLFQQKVRQKPNCTNRMGGPHSCFGVLWRGVGCGCARAVMRTAPVRGSPRGRLECIFWQVKYISLLPPCGFIRLVAPQVS